MPRKQASTIASAGDNDDGHGLEILENFGGLLIDQSNIAQWPAVDRFDLF